MKKLVPYQVLLGLFIGLPPAHAERSVTVSPKKGEAKMFKTAYYALIIGNDNYQYAPRLKTAVSDAREVDRVLSQKYGFKTKLVINGTRKDILNAINDYRKQLGEKDSLLIYYAGHGEYDNTADKAYWLPIDAVKDNPVDWIMADDITSNIKRIASKHVLIVSDSCYSGALTRSATIDLESKKGGRNQFLTKMMDRPSRTVMASGGNEPVADAGGRGNHSVFASAFLTALNDPDKKTFTAEELFHGRVKEIVAGKSDQVPQYNNIKNSGHEGGDFIFQFAQAVEDADVSEEPVATDAGTYGGGNAETSDSVYVEPTTGMEFVLVKGGCFQMGDVFGEGEADEKPSHEACVNDFFMGRHEVTVAQFRRFVDATDYRTDAEKGTGNVNGCWADDRDDKEKQWNWRGWANWKTPNKYQNNEDSHPVSCVSWNDAKASTNWLERSSGKTMRLPTEAEWEYAARGGTTTMRFWGSNPDQACQYANVADWTPLPGRSNWNIKFECSDGYAFVAPVGSFQPNAHGLYDMLGNVWEWTSDWYGEKYYTESPRNNPQGPSSGQYRTLRGGSWDYGPRLVRASNRLSGAPANRDVNYGFRLLSPAR
jgi:formylglycine-generating enzyme required for sulfatase activity